jgi:hypothetical protein
MVEFSRVKGCGPDEFMGNSDGGKTFSNSKLGSEVTVVISGSSSSELSGVDK